MKQKKPTINRVTTLDLDMMLRFFGIKLPYNIIDLIIDIVGILEVKGSKTNLKDVALLMTEHEDLLNESKND